MISLLILLIFLLCLLGISLRTTKFILAPQVGYIAGFVLQTFFCLFYVKQWEINLGINTILTVAGGATIFLFVSVLVNSLPFKLKRNQKGKLDSANEINKNGIIDVEFYKLFIFTVVQFIALLGYINFMNNNMTGSNIAEKIYNYRMLTADLGQTIPIPTILSFFRLFSSAIGYVLSYIFMNNLVRNNVRYRILFITNIILSAIVEGMLGARGGIVNFIIAIILEYLLIRYIVLESSISLGLIFKVFCCAVVIILFFPIMGALIGRPNLGIGYEIAVYLGAPLKNLDIFLSNLQNYQIRHCSTFVTIIKDIAECLPSTFNVQEQQFRFGWNYVNGNVLGNVYTTYAAFWYDLGGKGVIIFTSLIALISQLLYRGAIRKYVVSVGRTNIHIILYAYFFSTIVFSFFGNRFLNQLVSLYTIKFLIALIIVIIFIDRVKIVSRKSIVHTW